jgi:DNA recombination protein RmuC
LFLPNESFLYAALETQPDLVEFALEKKILIATPPTFIGLLKVIRFGWNEDRLAKNSEKIRDLGKEMHKRLVEFVDHYMAIGKHLESATGKYEEGLKRLNSRVLVQMRKMEKLGVKGGKDLPDELGYEFTEEESLTGATDTSAETG